jgi:hypothetical protein
MKSHEWEVIVTVVVDAPDVATAAREARAYLDTTVGAYPVVVSRRAKPSNQRIWVESTIGEE